MVCSLGISFIKTVYSKQKKIWWIDDCGLLNKIKSVLYTTLYYTFGAYTQCANHSVTQSSAIVWHLNYFCCECVHLKSQTQMILYNWAKYKNQMKDFTIFTSLDIFYSVQVQVCKCVHSPSVFHLYIYSRDAQCIAPGYVIFHHIYSRDSHSLKASEPEPRGSIYLAAP